ncbi:hypothetical protein ASE38_02120 [Cellulomonas sp. Root930]|nr:hypothetical protein ASE38_02120 [Cellulomonas sp. Root930]
MLAGARWLSIGAAANRSLPMLVLFIVLATGTPAEYGAYALALAIVALFTVAGEGGMTILTTSSTNLSHATERLLAARALRQGAAFYVGICATGFAVSQFSDLDIVLSYVAVLGVTVPFAGYSAVGLGRYQRAGAFRSVAVRQTIGTSLGVVVGLSMALAGAGVWSLVAQATISTAASYCLVALSREGRVAPDLRGRVEPTERGALRFAVWSNLVGAVGRRTDDLLIGLVLGPAALGLYAVGYRVLTILTELGLHPAERVSVAQLGKARTESVHTGIALLRRSQIGVMRLIGPVFVLAGVGSAFVIPVVLGSEWRQAGICSLILCLAGAIQSTYNLTFAGIYTLQTPARSFRYQLALIPALLVPALVGMVWGIVGAAAGYALGSVCGAVVAWLFRRELRRIDDPAHA